MAENTQNTGGAAATPAVNTAVKLERGSSDADIRKAYANGNISYYQISQAVFESTSDENIAKVRGIIEGDSKEK